LTNITSSSDAWETVTIGDIVSFEYGKALQKEKRDQSGNIPVYGSNGIVGFHSKALVTEPCLIVGRKGTAGEVHISTGPCWPIDTTYYVVPPKDINLRFLYYQLKFKNLSLLDRSTAIPGLNRNDAYAVEVAIPSTDEQEIIVSRIESLFSQLDAATAALKRVQANLKRYKASVLKAACEGQLVPTEAELARKEGRSYESGAELLERILKERRRRWEEEQRAKGKDPVKMKYPEPARPDTEELPELPEGWVWATVEQITENFDGKRIPLKASDRNSIQGKYPYYGASGIIDYINDFIFDGSFLLIAEDGANLLSRSTPIAFQAHGKFWVNNHAHCLRTIVSPLGYLETYINSLSNQSNVL